MSSQRLSRKDGHRRKFLAIIDETPECRRAVAYASRRAQNTGGSLVLLFVIDNTNFQQILGVGNIMQAEAQERARTTLTQIVAELRENQSMEPEQVICEGTPVEQIIKFIEEDRDIAVLVLAAGAGKESPGPLVQALVSRNAAFPVPVTVIPNNLSDADLDAVT